MSDNPEALRAELELWRAYTTSATTLPLPPRPFAAVLDDVLAALAQQAATPTPGPYSSDDEAVVCLMGLAAAYAVAYGGMKPNGNEEATQRAAESLSTAIRSVLAASRQAATPAPAEPAAAFEEAMRQTWRMIDPLHPAGQPGSYARGQDAGIAAALKTVRENFERLLAAPPATPAAQPADEREAFEAWLGRESFTERSDTGKYVSAHVDAMWSAWQARAALEGQG